MFPSSCLLDRLISTYWCNHPSDIAKIDLRRHFCDRNDKVIVYAHYRFSTFRRNLRHCLNLTQYRPAVTVFVMSWCNGISRRSYTRCSDKLGTLFLSSLSQTNMDRLSNFFHQVIRQKILYVHIIKISTSPAICCYTTL